MAEYIEREAVIADLKEQVEKGRDTAECEATELVIQRFAEYIKSFPAADVQPVDRDSLHIVYVGRKAYHAEKTIMSSIEAMYTIRDAIAHIEHTYSKHKELLSQISCCTESGDVTPEIDYYISKIKELASQID